MQDRPTHSLQPTGRPVRKAIRRLRWFLDAFHAQVARTSDATGLQFAVDEAQVTAVFVDWLRAFEAQKPHDPGDRRAYVGFAAGLMLRALIRRNPLAVTARPASANPDDPAQFWPEGYVYVAFCMNVRAAVLRQDFDETQAVAPELGDLRTWWSFRENVSADPSLSIAFLDLFAGDPPNWAMADVFQGAEARQLSDRFRAGAALDAT